MRQHYITEHTWNKEHNIDWQNVAVFEATTSTGGRDAYWSHGILIRKAKPLNRECGPLLDMYYSLLLTELTSMYMICTHVQYNLLLPLIVQLIL